MAIDLTYAGLRYFDRTLALSDGTVQIPGVRLEFRRFDRVEDLFRRQAQFAEFPVSEMSLGTFTVMLSRGDSRLVGLAVFPSRMFRHKDIYVCKASGISTGEQLKGKRVGVPEYQMTAAVWVRELLRSDYGVRPGDMTWFTGGLRENWFKERMPINIADDVSITRIQDGQSLEKMLLEGKIDALISTEIPRYAPRDANKVGRLFVDYGRVEREYFRRTAVFPIMHLVVLRRDVYEQDPSLAVRLTKAFIEAKRIGNQEVRFGPSLSVGLPWVREQIDEVDALFAGDAFPYGVEPNRHVLDVLTRAAFEQGLTPRRVGVDELFAPEVLHIVDDSGRQTA